MALFNGSTSLIQQATPLVTTVPFTVGFWFYSTGSNGYAWTMPNSGSGVTWLIYATAATGIAASFYDGATEFGKITLDAGTLPGSTWCYVLYRAITSSNRRMSILRPDPLHGQSTASITATTVNRMCLGGWNGSGAFGFFDGSICEFFFADADIVPDGSATPDDLLRQVAFGSPFSIDEFVPNIVEYQALDEPSTFNTREFYQRPGGGAWTYTAVATANDPGLSSTYIRPGQMSRLLLF